jgi:iron complex transport system ATP-binding protein
MNEDTGILNYRNLEIGFKTAKSNNVILPPLSAVAMKGELIAIIGKNGIGKSTLLRTIAGLQPLIAGDLSILGKDIKEYSRTRLSKKVGYISTEIIKASNMRVYDLVSTGRFPYTNWLGSLTELDKTIIDDAIKGTGMQGLKDRMVSELSDGERQKSMIAMVLAQDTPIMIMDEPTAFLDVGSRFEIMHLMLDLTRDENKTIIFSTHDLDTAINRADKIWMLNESGILTGAPEDLILNGAMNKLFEGSKVKLNPVDGTVIIHDKVKGKINVLGEGEKKYWTEKALIRAGYKIDVDESDFLVKIPSGNDSKWEFQIPGENQKFSSIYDMISWITARKSI